MDGTHTGLKGIARTLIGGVSYPPFKTERTDNYHNKQTFYRIYCVINIRQISDQREASSITFSETENTKPKNLNSSSSSKDVPLRGIFRSVAFIFTGFWTLRHLSRLKRYDIPSFCVKVSCPYLLYVGGWLVLAWELWTTEFPPCEEGALDCFPSSLAFSEARMPNIFCANCLPLLQDIQMSQINFFDWWTHNHQQSRTFVSAQPNSLAD